jgi:hypothetical protein
VELCCREVRASMAYRTGIVGAKSLRTCHQSCRFWPEPQSGVHGSAKRRSLPPTWTPPMVPCLRFRDSGNPCCSGFGRTHAAPSFGGSDVRSGSRTEASDREAEARQRFGDSSGGGHVAVLQTSENPLTAHG